MLILTRRIHESIIVGDEVFITLLSVKGYQARIGIDAPHMLSVHRMEVYNRIREDKGLPPVSHRNADLAKTQIANSLSNEREVKILQP